MNLETAMCMHRNGCTVSIMGFDTSSSVLDFDFIHKREEEMYSALKFLKKIGGGNPSDIEFEMQVNSQKEIKVGFLQTAMDEIEEEFEGIEDFHVAILGVCDITNRKLKRRTGEEMEIKMLFLNLESLKPEVGPIRATALVTEGGNLLFDMVFF